jgi:hypothetical protein
MNIQEYLRPKLLGERFRSHAIPLEFLRDLAVLEEMVVEVAKWRFLQEHPERRRSPRGFTNDIALTLSAVEEGSVIPVIALLFGGSLPLPNRVYYEQAREAIVGAISAVAENRPATPFLPEKALAYFDRFGRSLREGEAIEFPPSTPAAPPVRLTKDIRRKLLLASTEVKVLTEEVELRGAVHEANQEAMTFQITLTDGNKVPGPIPSQHFDNITDAFKGYKQGVKILLQGVGRFNRLGRLQGIETIEHTTLLDPQDIPARIEELKAMTNGWLDGRGIVPDPAGLDWLASIIESRYSEDLPLPYLYPVAEGGVRLEWSVTPQEVSLEIDFSQKSGEWHVLNLDTDAEESKTLNLGDEATWSWLIGRLSEMVGATTT